MHLPITDAMRDSHDLNEMVDAFHPTSMWGTFRDTFEVDVPRRTSHPSNVIDTIEAALLYGAGCISRVEFLQVAEQIGIWTEPGE